MLVGIDESADGRLALVWATRLAEAFAARLLIVDLWETPADQYDVDLIVIGNHHNGRLHQFLNHGLTHTRLLRKGAPSVLIANTDERHRIPRSASRLQAERR